MCYWNNKLDWLIDWLIANWLQSLAVKEFRKSVTFGEVIGKSRAFCFFLTHGVQQTTTNSIAQESSIDKFTTTW